MTFHRLLRVLKRRYTEFTDSQRAKYMKQNTKYKRQHQERISYRLFLSFIAEISTKDA